MPCATTIAKSILQRLAAARGWNVMRNFGSDAEFHVDENAPKPGRPAIAVSGTPDQVVSALRQVMESTGARRLLVETFSREEARLFAREVIPALKAVSAPGR